MTERDRQRDDFLAAAGWGAAERRKLAGDASFRTYDRLRHGDGRRAVLMNAPPPQEDVRPFIRIARHLSQLGLSAPKLLAEDPTHGFLLLEDLGDDTYTRRLAAGDDEEKLYALAVDVLIALHRRPVDEAAPEGVPPYDDARLQAEADLLIDWYLPAASGQSTSDALRESYRVVWRDLYSAVHATPRSLVLRDYHVDNLMWLGERSGVAACGLLDFQDALVGSVAYDLMSLLEDARRDIDPGLIARQRARYEAAFPDLDRAAFERAFAILGAQRHAKVIGIFTRLCKRDGKAHYLVHIPRVWRLLERSCAHPALAPIQAWLDRHIPSDLRRIPPCP